MVLGAPPASDVVRAADHSWLDALSDPYLVDEEANLGLYLEQVTFCYTELRGVFRMYPYRVAMSDFD